MSFRVIPIALQLITMRCALSPYQRDFSLLDNIPLLLTKVALVLKPLIVLPEAVKYDFSKRQDARLKY
jgi:hypothetical protein